jgi:hypothetical protein
MEISDLKQTWQGVKYAEAMWSPTRTHASNRSSTKRNIYFDYAFEQDVVQAFLGWSTIVTNPTNGKRYISRIPPHQDDKFPSQYAMGMTTEPYGVNDLPNTPDTIYKFGKAAIDYSTPLFGIMSDSDMINLGLYDANGNPDESSLKRYCIVNGAFDTSFLALNKDSMKMADYPVIPLFGKPSFPGSVGFVLSLVNYNVQWLEVPREAVRSRVVNPTMSPAEARIDINVSRINFNSMWGWAPGQLLLLGVAFKPCTNAHGDFCYDITFLFRAKQHSHDRVFWPPASKAGIPAADPGWVQLSVDDTAYLITTPPPDGKLIYNVGALETCFQCAP